MFLRSMAVVSHRNPASDDTSCEGAVAQGRYIGSSALPYAPGPYKWPSLQFFDEHSEFSIRISHTSYRSFHHPMDIW